MDKTLAYVALCRIERGGFSGERLFRVKQASGAEYIGVAPVEYCRHRNGSPIALDEPRREDTVDGLVDVLFLSNGGDEAKIEVPSGDVISVKNSELLRQVIKATDYVSV
jgi:hypothetical protein